MRNTLIPILVAICLFITGVAILNIQLWYSAKAEYLAGARYAANNIMILPSNSGHAAK
ncbi:hypothetical protein LT910_004806 [Escherichia coli]|nr:hypothetical protein [Escherichia coli]